MEIEISRHEDLRLLSHIIDVDVTENKLVRVFQDFSCKWTDEPVLFQPFTALTKH